MVQKYPFTKRFVAMSDHKIDQFIKIFFMSNSIIVNCWKLSVQHTVESHDSLRGKFGCKIFSIEIFFFFRKISVLREKKIPLRKIPTRIFAYPGDGNLPLCYYIATFFFFFKNLLLRNPCTGIFGVGDLEKKRGGSILFLLLARPPFRKPTGFFSFRPWSGKNRVAFSSTP